MADSNYIVSGLPPKEWVQLKLTKKLTIINAQNKAEDIDVGAVLYGIPTETKGKYIYRTEGVNYELMVGKNAEIFTNTNANNSDLKKMQNQQLGSYMFVGAIVVLSYIAYKVIVKK
jgi:hypothetical protein